MDLTGCKYIFPLIVLFSIDAAIFRSTLARALGIACVDDAIVWYDGYDIMIYYDIYIYYIWYSFVYVL